MEAYGDYLLELFVKHTRHTYIHVHINVRLGSHAGVET